MTDNKTIVVRGVSITIDYPIAKITFKPSRNSGMMRFLQNELESIAATERQAGIVKEMHVRMSRGEVDLHIDQNRHRLGDEEAKKKLVKAARKIASTIANRL